MPRSLIRQANWADIPDLVKAGVQPSWRMAPVRQEVGISHAILEYILDPRNTRFIVLIQLERPRFAMPGSMKNITAVALLEKPHDNAPIAPDWSPYAKPCAAFTTFANLTATEVERRRAAQDPDAGAEMPERYMHLHMLAVSSPGDCSDTYLDRVKAMLDEAWVTASGEEWGLTLASTVDVRAGPKLFKGFGFRAHCVWMAMDEAGQLVMMSKDPQAPMDRRDKLFTTVGDWFRRSVQRRRDKSRGFHYIFNMGDNVPLWALV